MTTHPSEKQHFHLLGEESKTPITPTITPNTVETHPDIKLRTERIAAFNRDVNVILERVGSQQTQESYKALIALRATLGTLFKTSLFTHSLLQFLNVAKGIFEKFDAARLQKTLGQDDLLLLPNATEEEAVYNIQVQLNTISREAETKASFEGFLSLWTLMNTTFFTNFDTVISTDPEVARLFNEVKQIVESYTNTPLDMFLLRLRALVAIIDKDEEFKSFIKQCVTDIQLSLIKPETSAVPTKHSHDLYAKGVEIVRKYQNHPDVRPTLYEALAIAEATKADDQVSALQQHVAKVVDNVSHPTADGGIRLDSNFLPILQKELVPFLRNKIKEVPVKGFKISNPDFAYLIVDDITVSVGEDIMPDRIRFKSENQAELKMNDHTDPLKARSYVDVAVDGLHLEVKDFFFSFKRITPIVDVEDEGRGTVKLVGSGLSIQIKFELSVDAKRSTPALQKATVSVSSGDIDLTFTEAKHKLILNMAAAFFKKNIKDEVENAIKLNLEGYCAELADLLNKQIVENLNVPTPVTATTATVNTTTVKTTHAPAHPVAAGVTVVPIVASTTHPVPTKDVSAIVNASHVVAQTPAVTSVVTPVVAKTSVVTPVVAKTSVVTPVVAKTSVVTPVVAKTSVVTPVVAQTPVVTSVVTPVVAQTTAVTPVVVAHTEPVVDKSKIINASYAQAHQ